MKKIFISVLFLFMCSLVYAQSGYRDSLKQQLAKVKDDRAKVDLLFNLGFNYAFEYEDTAISYANEGLELSRKIGYKAGEGNCLEVLSMSLTLFGNYINALKYGFDFLSVAESMKDTSMIVNAYDNLGLCYREQEDYIEALKFERTAESLLKFIKIKSDERNLGGFVYGDLGSIYERSNRLDSALYYCKKAFELVGNGNWSGIYLYIGNIYVKLKETDSALYYYHRGIPIAERSSINIDLLDIYNQMSGLFETLGNKDSAIYYSKKSITQVGASSYPEGKLRAVTQLAKLYEMIGQKDSTIKYLKLSVDFREKLFGREKTREAQSLALNEKAHQQELAAQHEQEQNKIKLYSLLFIILIFLIVAFIQWRNNKQKQKANKVLEATLTNLKSTQSQLIQSEKMASLGELTAGIAHEIQNPLNFVNNFSEVNKELLTEMKDEMNKGNIDDANAIANDVIDNEEKINHHGKRADAIVKGMLQHSRSSSGVKELTDINALADEYLRLAYHGLRAKDKSFNSTLKTDYDEGIGNINIIPQDIGRVLLNLYNNAFYAVQQKQKGTVGKEMTSFEKMSSLYEPAISVSTKKVDNKITITVKDNGNGIPKNIVDKIFQPFFTTKPTGQGTGLGLSLSYDIIKAHGGEIKVETKEGEGTEFIIQLATS